MLGLVYDSMRNMTTPQMRWWIKSQKWFVPVSRAVFGNEIYSNSYYKQIEEYEADSVKHISAWIDSHISPKAAVDVGSGPGHLSKVLMAKGIDVLGIDISNAAKQFAAMKGIKFQHFDLTKIDPLPGGPWDLIVCCEVAEHLEERFADTFIQNLTSFGDLVYITAAEPNNGGAWGLNHVNEQPNSYWIDLFHKRGFALNAALTDGARNYLKFNNVLEYLAKPLIFGRVLQ
jgi:SAM-dependent methyltransferase